MGDKRRALSAKEDELKSWLNWKSSIMADKAFCIGGRCARLSTETTSIIIIIMRGRAPIPFELFTSDLIMLAEQLCSPFFFLNNVLI